MSELPDGWAETTIGDVAAKAEQRVPLSKDEFFYVDISSIDRIAKRIVNPPKFMGENAPSRARQVIKRGDVLVSMPRPNLNAVAMVPDELNGQIASTGFDVLRPQGIDARWLYYAVQTEDFVSAMSALVQGALYPAIRPKDIRDYLIFLAPLPEQKRIADKLDSFLARVDACQTQLERIPHMLKHLRQSTLAAATSGRLTEEWRKENNLPFEWETVKLSDISTSRLGKMLDAAKNQGELRPYLRNVNVRWFDFDLDDIQQIKVSDEEAKTLSICKGDVLICEGGEPGRCAVWKGEDNIYIYQKALHRVRVGERVLPEWVCYHLKSAADSGLLVDYFTGTTIKHFTGISLSQFEFALPPLPEQHEIIRRVEDLFAFAGQLEERWRAAQQEASSLVPTILAKAFRGELVEQDANDEPAEMLLERIRIARANAPKEIKQPRRRVKVKTSHEKIGVIKALENAAGELSADALFQAAGYPPDAESELVEEFFVELRDAIKNGQIAARRLNHSDWFSLKGGKHED